MKPNSTLSFAIAAVLGSTAAGTAHAAPPPESAVSDTIQEITVTAQRRTESMQNVPITIQALTGESLTQLNVQNFDDFVKYLPNVTVASAGPGQGAIFMRGLSTTQQGTQGAGSVGSFTSVAIYLDEQSGGLPGRNLDIYAADLERIEVLEGPQGTLFGAGAESGVMRYITNKPKLSKFEGSVSGGYETTAHGDPSASVEGVLNIPLIEDKLAVRGVVYSDARGGYINNIPATFTRQASDYTIGNYEGGVVPTGPGSINTISNSALAKNGINTVNYKGMRVQALWKINDDWDALLSQSYQTLDTEGVFYQMPHSSSVNPALQQPLPDLSVELFNPSYNHDRFEGTALTINGKIGDLKLVYAGGYLTRNIEQQNDYTAYSRGANAAYYQCTPIPFPVNPPNSSCFSPSAYWRDVVKNTHQSHELRLSTPDDKTVRGIVGVFWEDYKIHDNTDWFYKSVPSCQTVNDVNCLTNVGPPPGTQVNNPNIRPDNESYFDDVTRGYKQTAVFGSVDFELVPKTLTLTLGTRYYRIKTTEVGFSASSFGCSAGGPPPCTGNQVAGAIGVDSNNETANGFDTTYKGWRSRANLSWKVTPDAMVYYTWSQGFRPGGFNRGATEFCSYGTAPCSPPIPNGQYDFVTPREFTPDWLTNNEIGWKTQWFDRHFEFNGAVYQEDWKNIQVELFLPQKTGNLSYTANGPSYKIKGLEMQAIARPAHGLTLTLGAAWNSSHQEYIGYLKNKDGSNITVFSPFGDPGVPLAASPPLQLSGRVRYEFPVADYLAFAQAGGQHQAHSISSIASASTSLPDQPGYAYNMPAFTTYDAAMGFGKDTWTVQAYGENLSDKRAIVYENPNQFVDAQTVIRPRTFGLRLNYRF